MPRRPRMYIPGYCYHIVQRGNNREACFYEPENYRIYLKYMEECLPRYGNYLHAYCLMTNHVHLLVSPAKTDSISNLLKVVCSRYAQYINKKYSRTGTLWEGRHKSSPVDTELYLLKCYRYIELNPVAARMVNRPEEYMWSSYHHNAWGEKDPLVSQHDLYAVLGQNEIDRCSNYRELFRDAISTEDIHAIRKAAHYSIPLGSNEFADQIARKTGKPAGYGQRGRPPKDLVKNKSLRPL